MAGVGNREGVNLVKRKRDEQRGKRRVKRRRRLGGKGESYTPWKVK